MEEYAILGVCVGLILSGCTSCTYTPAGATPRVLGRQLPLPPPPPP